MDNKKQKNETAKLNRFLAGLSVYQRILIHAKLTTSSQFRECVRETGWSKEQVCEKWDLSPSDYDKIYNGTHEFDLRTLAKLKANYNDWQIFKAMK
jgi:hypothetical protein